MAQYQLAQIIILDPVDVSFSANDIVRVFWDDSTEEIVVTLNGGSFTTATAILGDPPTQTSGGNYQIMSGVTSTEDGDHVSGYSFCDGTSLVWFSMVSSYPQYPFFGKRITEDSPVCDTGGGAVCDIHWVGSPTITHAVSQTEGGSIQVAAESSNGVVKYSLRKPDSYDDANNTTGLITLLPPGNWTVYAVDPNNCIASKSFQILYQPTEGEHYRFTWASKKIQSGTSRDARLRIYEREYVGDVVEIDYGHTSPFKLYKPKQGEINDKFFPVHPTNAEVSLASLKDYQFLPLFTQDNKKYRGVYEVDEGSGFTTVWQGFEDPNVYQEDFIATPYFVGLRFSDNVKTLETEKFADDDGNLLTGDMKLIKVIALIMKKTGLNLKIRSGLNIFETNHNTAATDDPLDQTYVDVTCYREESEPFDCWRVLESILRPFGARIFQYDNQWIIEEIDRAVEEYAYRVFDADGVYESNSTFDPIIDVKNPSLTNRAALVQQDHSAEIIPAYGNIDIVSKLNYVGSIVAGGFEKEDLLSPESETENKELGVYTSEEGFTDWTLRLNGTSGVSFGRVVIGDNPGGASRRGIQEDDLTRSVGAFFYNPDAWSGNLRNAYIESSAKAYQYGPGSEIRIKFEYSTPAKPEYEFMVLRIMVKVGTNYLQQNLTWDTTESIYRAYPKVSNSLQSFDLTVPAPDADVVTDSTIQMRIYFYASSFFDYGLPTATTDPEDGTDGLSGLDSLVTDGVEYDYRLDLRREITIGGIFEAYFREFYELRVSDATEDVDAGRIRAGDYDGTTNPKLWWRLKSINIKSEESNTRRRGVDLKFYVDNVAADSLLNGQPPPETDTISLPISKFINENLEVELYNFDVPNITNGKNMYNNYFRLSDGTPTSQWARSGISEALTLQQILLKVLGSNHSAPTFRLTGSFVNEFARIGINNYLRITKTGSSLSAQNTEFTSNLDNWTNSGSGESFAWTADNSGSAGVTLTGAEDSKKLYQSITHSGGYIKFTVNVHVEPGISNDREDVLWVLFYRGSSIIHTEKMRTFSAMTSDDDFDFTYTAFLPGNADRIGFYFRRVTGTGTCTYQVGQFKPEGTDIEEVYQITDYTQDERQNIYFLELMQISKTYISLSGVDTGGNNQGGSTTGRAHSSGHSSGFN